MIIVIVLTLILLTMLYATLGVKFVASWSNGGYGGAYGTHDWIAQHALDWLPTEEKQYILDNADAYVYGTELPDNPSGIGDSVMHHIYYYSSGALQDDASAARAREEYYRTLDFLRAGMLENASKNAGIMSHYIVDVAVFGHVMSAGTDWGAEVHHEDYETYVNDKTNNYEDEFNGYLVFDGELRVISAYNAALELAHDTTFDGDGSLTCVWMDQNYNWTNEAFRDRCGESLNLAVNYLADVLHTLYRASASATRYPWPMFHQNLRHTGYSESPAPTTNKTQWTYTTGSAVFSSPAVADGRVYVGSDDYNVYCLDALTGAYIWSYTTGYWVRSPPVVVDGKVYVGSLDYKVYCLNALTGAYIWSYTTGSWVYSSPAVVDGKVYVGSYDGKVYCLDAATGAYIWSYTTGYYMVSSPAVVDGKVYVGSYDGKVYCLDAATGAYIWSYTTGSEVYSSPAVVDGRVYVGSGDYNVYCLDALTGAYIWSYITGGRVISSPAVAGRMVFVGSFDRKVYCLDAATGAYIWSYTTGSLASSSPAVADGMVYVGSYDKKIYAFGNVIRVPEDYPTIQEAINNATSGATISIALGVYHESLVINKPLTLLGRKGSDPVFDGGGSGIAITITGTCEVTITGIVITSYNQAIFIDDSSDCEIYNNIMTSNHIAINLTDTSISNTIYTNTISGNAVGINVANSVATTIYHNNFVSNTQQICISMPTGNIWDNGYPSGGNYWSDYTGVDEKRGPNQNLPGSDGIGDTHYTIDDNNIDNYPLMKPFSPHDIGITNVTLSKTIIAQGFTLHIDLKILNYGMDNEAFTVTVYANTIIIATQTITLTSRNSTTITFIWNTSGFAKGNYPISAYAEPVPSETDTEDNNCLGGWILVAMVGDLGGGVPPQFFNCDGKVDGKDLSLFLQCFKGTAPPEAMYLGDLGGGVPPQFFNCDGKVDGKDLSLFLQCFKGLGPDP
jgi:outer membrane protein assembly factor BamB